MVPFSGVSLKIRTGSFYDGDAERDGLQEFRAQHGPYKGTLGLD